MSNSLLTLQMIQVNSEATTYLGANSGSWSYSTPESLLPISTMNRAGSGTASFTLATGTGLPRSNFCAGQFHNQSPFINNPSGVSYTSAPARTQCPHSFDFGDDPYDPTIMPPFILPLQDVQTTSHLQNWTPIPDPVGRPGNSTLSLVNGQLPFTNVIAESFPGMRSLASSLPGRTLPNPTARLLQPNSNVLLSQGALNDSNAPPTLTPRTNHAWEQEHWAPRGSNQSSTNLTSISSGSGADRPTGRTSGEQVSRDSSSYALLAPASTAEAISSPLSRFPQANLTESTSTAASLRLPTAGYSTGQSSDSTLSSQASSDNLYPFNNYSMRSGLGQNLGTESMVSESTLGGFSYSPLPPPQLQSFHISSRRSSQEILTPHRAMMTSRS